jgi:hypothetical protein
VSEQNDPAVIRYRKPKILIIDLPAKLGDRLRTLGYNVQIGTFGRRYRVKMSDAFVPIVAKPSLPNFAEQEVVVIDLTVTEVADGPEAEKTSSPGAKDWYAEASSGIIDPRPMVMRSVRKAFDRILDAGGVFVIFAEPRIWPTMVFGWIDPHVFRGGLQVEEEIKEHTWSFLTVLSSDHLRSKAEYGNEITVSDGLGALSFFLRRHISNSTFSTTLHPEYRLTTGDGPVFRPLATNKFGENVAGVVVGKKSENGLVVILPQLENKEEAVLELITKVLPEILPRMFPDHEGGRWVHREEYEHPIVLEKKAAQLEIQRKANEEIAKLDQEIETQREQLAFLHGLLSKTGKPLVADVKRALEYIGFRKVVDVDEAGASTNKQEDLQVLDGSPTILLEIKGMTTLPREADTLQVTKYVQRRMKEWDNTDVIGLSLINHERNIPALERNNANVFTEQQVRDAEHFGAGLMPTWDLFRLIRGMVRWGWPQKAVRDVLCGSGRVSRFPSHYVLAGVVAHYWTEKSVLSIHITNEGLRVGHRVGYLLADGFFEEDVTSLELNRQEVQEANPTQQVGMKTTLGRSEVPVGTLIFRVGN